MYSVRLTQQIRFADTGTECLHKPRPLAATAQKVTFEAFFWPKSIDLRLHCNKCSEDALEDIDIALNVSTNYAEQLSTYIPDLHTKLTA